MSTDKQHSENENIPVDEGPQEELSLDQLSQAYAKVLQVRKREAGGSESAAAEMSENVKSKALLDLAVAKKSKKRKGKSLAEIDAQDNSPCPISPESILEAILFVGVPKGVKLDGRKIASVMRDVSPKEVKKMAGQLNNKYKDQNAAYRVVIDNGNFSLQLTNDLDNVQDHYFGRNRAARLSQSAIDVLAVIAYNQPVSREQVEKICGKSLGAILSQLVRRNLLEIEQTTTKPVKKTYRTTDQFLELFRLESIEDLPRASAVSDLEELAD